MPTLEEYGVEVAMTAVQDAPGLDIPSEDALWDVIVERIRASGADTVVINGDTTAAFRSIARNNLDVAMWAIKADQVVNLGSSATRADAEGAITIQGLTDVEARHDDPSWSTCPRFNYPANAIPGADQIRRAEASPTTLLPAAGVDRAQFDELVVGDQRDHGGSADHVH